MAPKRRGRFSKLDAQLRAVGGSPGTDSRLGRFLQWRTGTRKINVTGRATSEYLRRFSVGVIPFNQSPDTAQGKRYAANITVLADNIRLKIAGVTANEWGIETTGTFETDSRYSPAYARVKVNPSGVTAPSSKISDITGESYKRIRGRSGSIPFGRTVTSVTDAETKAAKTTIENVAEEDVKASLITQLKGADASAFGKVASVSFVSEFWLPRGSQNSRPDGVSTDIPPAPAG